jgi:hypothetical protein
MVSAPAQKYAIATSKATEDSVALKNGRSIQLIAAVYGR